MADLTTGAHAPPLPETLRLKLVYRKIDQATAFCCWKSVMMVLSFGMTFVFTC